MEHKRRLTMSWEGLGEEDEDIDFYDSKNRVSSVGPADSDDEIFDDGRASFASAISSSSFKQKQIQSSEASHAFNLLNNYDVWMSDPVDINERRKRLLQGMGLGSNKDLSTPAISTKADETTQNSTKFVYRSQESTSNVEPPSTTTRNVLIRSRSNGEIISHSVDTKMRKQEMIGAVSKQCLTRTSTGFGDAINLSPNRSTRARSSSKNKNRMLESSSSNNETGSFFLIKNLDTGKEFVLKKYNELSDLQTGKQLSMDEFEKCVGYSPVVKELMRRENYSKTDEDGRKVHKSSYFKKSFRGSKRMGAALLKNITNSMSGHKPEKEMSNPASPKCHGNSVRDPKDQKSKKNPSSWVKVRHHGRSCKEFTALYRSQEIQAHQGSIWTIKFSTDSNYLASAGEDKVIHVWEVQELEVMSSTPTEDDFSSNRSTPVHPVASSATDHSPLHLMCGTTSDKPPIAEITPLSSKKVKNSKKKRNTIPDYVNVPETVFSLSENPICSFKGHLEDVLDLSWSTSQLLISSSMDKTVRLWDMETKCCLKMFAHNDYVTCIHFNPLDDDYFISGSLDGKIRIWDVPGRQVVDWMDLHEMVTAAHYTPDGQGVIIGSHKGICRRYTISDCKLRYDDLIEVQTKKSQAKKKITGIEFSKFNQDEVLITSADSRIRILDGSDLVHKFKGFRNTSSQISASFSPEGKYVMSASEDSQVYIWKREESQNTGAGKGKRMVRCNSYEYFHCKNVSVAIPWPGSLKHEPPIVEVHSKRHHSKKYFPPSHPHTSNGSLNREDHNNYSSLESSRKHHPPLPRNSSLDRSRGCLEEDFSQSSRIDDTIDLGGGGEGDSFISVSPPSSPGRFPESPSASTSGSSPPPSWSSSCSFLDRFGTNNNFVQATAWGAVFVTAGLGGKIRVFQNFGLPLKVSRQTHIFS